MRFKYSGHIDSIEGCPPSDYHNTEATVFRWVHKAMSHPNDFLVVALINPRRINDPAIDLREKCKGFGLSFYNSRASAQQQYRTKIAAHRRLVETIGEYVAEGKLTKSDGVISPVDKRSGHLTFYEYAGVDLKEKFMIIGRADSNE
jgi:hypothetical protein